MDQQFVTMNAGLLTQVAVIDMAYLFGRIVAVLVVLIIILIIVAAGRRTGPPAVQKSGYCTGPNCTVPLPCDAGGRVSGQGRRLADIIGAQGDRRIMSGLVRAYSSQTAVAPVGVVHITRPIVATWANLEALERQACRDTRGQPCRWFVLSADTERIPGALASAAGYEARALRLMN